MFEVRVNLHHHLVKVSVKKVSVFILDHRKRQFLSRLWWDVLRAASSNTVTCTWLLIFRHTNFSKCVLNAHGVYSSLFLPHCFLVSDGLGLFDHQVRNVTTHHASLFCCLIELSDRRLSHFSSNISLIHMANTPQAAKPVVLWPEIGLKADTESRCVIIRL